MTLRGSLCGRSWSWTTLDQLKTTRLRTPAVAYGGTNEIMKVLTERSL